MITIITPVYNTALYIESCMQSVAGQYFEGLEHLIMDAGSTDGTVEKIKAFAARNPHIRWISEKDKGQSDAMNKGIGLARNPVISFLNADDWYEPGALKTAKTYFENAPPNSFLVGNCRVLKENGEVYMINKPFPFDPVAFMIDYTFPYNPSAYFYHKSLHEMVGLYQVDDHYTMDIDFILSIMPVANIYYQDQILGNYVMIATSKTMTEIASGRNRDNLERVFEKHIPNLSLTDRIRLRVHKGLGKNRGWIMYYYHNPGAFLKRLFSSAA